MIRTKARKGSLDRAAIEALARGDHGDPFGVLGPHADDAGGAGGAHLPAARRRGCG